MRDQQMVTVGMQTLMIPAKGKDSECFLDDVIQKLHGDFMLNK